MTLWISESPSFLRVLCRYPCAVVQPINYAASILISVLSVGANMGITVRHITGSSYYVMAADRR
jgi:hypothetical protein